MPSPTTSGFPCLSMALLRPVHAPACWTPRHAAPLLRTLPPAARATPGDATPLLRPLQPPARATPRHSTALLRPRQKHFRLCPGDAATLLRTLHAAARATPQPTILLLLVPGATRRAIEAARSLPAAPPPALEGTGPALLSAEAAARWPRHRPGLPPHLRLLEHQLAQDTFCTTSRADIASWTLAARS